MLEIEIIADGPKDLLNQIKDVLGGEITEKWNEYALAFDNENARGIMRYMPFDWGVNLIEFDVTFSKEIILKVKASDFNPIRFIYNYNGDFKHRFGINNDEKLVEQFHSLIFTNKTGGFNHIHFPKDKKLKIDHGKE